MQGIAQMARISFARIARQNRIIASSARAQSQTVHSPTAQTPTAHSPITQSRNPVRVHTANHDHAPTQTLPMAVSSSGRLHLAIAS